MLLIGSSTGYFNRKPSDVDIAISKLDFLELNLPCSYTESGASHIHNGIKYDFCFTDKWPSYNLIESQCDLQTILAIGTAKVPSLELMCVIKKSHLYRELNFYKHCEDFHHLWKQVGNNENDFDKFLVDNNLKELYHTKLMETKSHFPDKTPSLNKSKEEFFNDYVVKFFHHDDIHKLVAHKEKPMYEYCQKEEVICDKELWLQLSYEDKISMVREEALTIALERKIIPVYFEEGNYHIQYKSGFYWAVMRICTTLCRGWFREFAQMNYKTIIDYDFKSKFNKFFDDYKEGKIKLID